MKHSLIKRKGLSLIVFKLAVSIFFVFCFCGCKKKEPIDLRQQMNMAECRSIINDSGCDEPTKQLARKVLQNWNNQTVDSKPILFHAGYVDFGKDSMQLILQFSDENFDVLGFVVEEYIPKDSHEEMEAQETYPKFGTEGVGCSKFIIFSVRQENNSMDTKLWEKYEYNGGQFATDDYPSVFISLPSDSRKIYVYLYDSEGNTSNVVPLKQGGVGKLSNLRISGVKN